MAETMTGSGSRPTPGRASGAAAVLAAIAAVVYWVLFSPGWGFLLAAGIVVGVLYVLLPYVRASLQ